MSDTPPITRTGWSIIIAFLLVIIVWMCVEIATLRKERDRAVVVHPEVTPFIEYEEEYFLDPNFDILDIIAEKSETELPLETVEDWNTFLDSIAGKSLYIEPFYDLTPLQFDVYALEVIDFLSGVRETAPELPEKLSQ